MKRYANINIDPTENLDRYMAEACKHKMLTREQEEKLTKKLYETGDKAIMHQLAEANLRFVVKVAHSFGGYGFNLQDLIQEGNAGLVHGISKFDPNKGYRLLTYCVWWISAYIKNYIIRHWSLVRIGTTQAQRTLFFRLRTERANAETKALFGEEITAQELARRFNVQESDVIDMELRLASRDFSLDTKIRPWKHYMEGWTGVKNTYLDALAATSYDLESEVQDSELKSKVREKISEILDTLNDRERLIIFNRLMSDEPETLESIGRRFDVSRERARQIESTLKQKLKAHMEEYGLEELVA